MTRLPIYLDYNATTPCDPRVVEAMMPYFTDRFGNAASRDHSFGWQAEEAVNIAREQVAKLINAEPGEIIFTSGATESINLALKGVFEAYHSKGNHVITCCIEHRAVLDTCQRLEMIGADVTYLPVKSDGLPDLEELDRAFKPNTVLVAIMYANNEIGTVMPVKEIGAMAKRRGVLVFSDATQALGKIPVDVKAENIDMLAFSSHKIYGPKGSGGLYVRRRDPRVKIIAQMQGGGHEKGLRSGTLNVPGIVGFGKACDILTHEMTIEITKIKNLRDKLENELLSLQGTVLNSNAACRLPNVTNISFVPRGDDTVLSTLSGTLAVSSGSACTSATLEPSYVLKATGLSDEVAANAIRFSLGRFTTDEEIDFAIDEVTRLVNRREPEKIRN